MTRITEDRSTDALAETVELYQHLVRDHGWDENPYLLSQDLRRRHRDAHVDDDCGVGHADHTHEGPAA